MQGKAEMDKPRVGGEVRERREEVKKEKKWK